MDYQQKNQRYGNGGQHRPGMNSNSAGAPPNRNNMNQASNAGGGTLMGNMNVQAEILFLKQETAQSRSAIFSLEQEKDSLRKAIRKLKLENTRVRQKVKRLQETINEMRGTTNDAGSDVDLTELDYDELGHNFLLVGGVQDPLSSSFESRIKDDKNVEHRSAERLYWYMIADHFKDEVAKKKILEASNSEAAENAVKAIQNFNEKEWNEHRVEAWKRAQKMKLDQHRDILNMLVLSKGIYIGLASHDKFFGTGWRKNREEANKPVFWDGENEGGKILMRLRDEYKETHTFNSKEEEDNAQKKFNYNRRFVWRRIDPARRVIGMGGIAQPPIVRTGLANRRGFWNNRRPNVGGFMGYGAPLSSPYYPSSNMTGNPYNQQPQQHWSNKKRDTAGGQYH